MVQRVLGFERSLGYFWYGLVQRVPGCEFGLFLVWFKKMVPGCERSLGYFWHGLVYRAQIVREAWAIFGMVWFRGSRVVRKAWVILVWLGKEGTML